MPDEAIFPQEYFVYCKEKWRTADGKDPLFGHVDGFQIDPKKPRREKPPAGGKPLAPKGHSLRGQDILIYRLLLLVR